MPLNTENESNIPENSDDTTQRLEKYGVWVKKAPHELKHKTDSFQNDDTTLSLDELSGITNSFHFVEEEPETEEVSLEDFGIEEQQIIEETEEELPEQSAFDSFDEEMNSLLSEEQEVLAPKEITETEEFIIDNGGEEASRAEVTNFSADDVFADVIEENNELPEVDLSQFDEFNDTIETVTVDDTPVMEETEFDTDSFTDEISGIENEPSLEVIKETENTDTVPSIDDIDLSEFTDGDIDLSAFMDDSEPSQKPGSNSSEEIDLDSFMSDDSSGGFSDGDIDLSSFMDSTESVHLDSFLPSDKKTVQLVDEPPLNIHLSFDDDYAGITKADPVNDVETISIDSDGSISEFSSFDAMFDSITDDAESFTDFPSEDKEPSLSEKKNLSYDDASEFDDLLTSLDDTPQVQVTKDDGKSKMVTIDYDLSINLEDDVASVITEKDDIEDSSEAEIDDIPLFSGDNSGTFYKELEKTENTGYTIPKVLEAGSDMEFDELDDLLKEADLVSDIPENDKVSFDNDTIQETDNTDFEDVMINPSSDEEDVTLDNLSFENETVETSEIDDFDISFDETDSFENESAITETVEESDTDIFEMDVNSESIPLPSDELILDNTEEDLLEFNNDAMTNSFEGMDDIDAMQGIRTDTVQENNDTFDNSIDIDDSSFEVSDTVEASHEDENDVELEIDIELPQDSVTEDTNPDVFEEIIETDEEIIEDSGFEEDVDSDLDLEETIDNVFMDELIEEEPSIEHEQENSMDSVSNPLLDKIAEEIAVLRAEISSLKNELSTLKNKDISAAEDTPKESGGFFTDDEGDDTIALSGDELNNILINADFTEEYAESPIDEPIESVSIPNESVSIPNEDSDDVESSIADPAFEETPDVVDEEIVDEAQVNESIEESSDVQEEELELTTDSTPSIDEQNDIQLEPFDPFGSVGDLDSISEIEQENFFEDDEITVDENLQEPSPEELSIDTMSFIPSEDTTIEDEAAIPNVEDIIVGPANTDLMESMDEPIVEVSEPIVQMEEDLEESLDEPVEETLDENTESTLDEPVEEALDDNFEENLDEPVDTVFEGSQWEEESVTLSDDTLIESSPDSTMEEMPQEDSLSNAEVHNSVVPQDLQQDIKSVLKYMDQLLENLPEEKIEEFARSEHFNVYKKLFNELGLV